MKNRKYVILMALKYVILMALALVKNIGMTTLPVQELIFNTGTTTLVVHVLIFITGTASPPVTLELPEHPDDDSEIERSKVVCEGYTGRIVCAKWARIEMTQVGLYS